MDWFVHGSLVSFFKNQNTHIVFNSEMGKGQNKTKKAVLHSWKVNKYWVFEIIGSSVIYEMRWVFKLWRNQQGQNR